jgi:hypothetical protein
MKNLLRNILVDRFRIKNNYYDLDLEEIEQQILMILAIVRIWLTRTMSFKINECFPC